MDIRVIKVLLASCLVLGILAPAASRAEDRAADVVVIVDTSMSMRDPGMDPERASLLVTKLLSDIAPGRLAAIRLLDLTDDRDLLPSRATGEKMPCLEDPSQQCERVEPANDWQEQARRNQFGVLTRRERGDAGFKDALVEHLAQKSANSVFYLAFAAAEGLLESHPVVSLEEDIPRIVVWLSDGRASHPEIVRQQVQALESRGIEVAAIVFGQGDPQLARAAGLEPLQVSDPSDMMRAFANVFRQIIRAPYRIDHRLRESPSFEMKPHVDEAWIVVYGDETLERIRVRGPGQEIGGTYAEDRWKTAGAYRVAHVKKPAAGTWTVEVTGGGEETAYAVVQRSLLTPTLLEPRDAVSGTETTLVASVLAGLDGQVITEPSILGGLVLAGESQGQFLSFEATESPGKFAASMAFHSTGTVPVELRLKGQLVDRRTIAHVEVRGEFTYTGGVLELDLGDLGVASESCRELKLEAAHRGEVAFELEALKSLPGGHRLEIRLPRGTLEATGATQIAEPGDRWQVCLLTSKTTGSSRAEGEPWLRLVVAGSSLAAHQVPIRLAWNVTGLTFWQRWGWLVLTVLGAFGLALLIGGYVLPHRFPRGLAVAFGPELDDLDEVVPLPIQQWPGVGIGFYRHARAFLHADYRLSGSAQGALACLHAKKSHVAVGLGKGQSLFRESTDGRWDRCEPPGRRGRGGEVFRIGEKGPFFRLSMRGKG